MANFDPNELPIGNPPNPVAAQAMEDYEEEYRGPPTGIGSLSTGLGRLRGIASGRQRFLT